VTHGGQQLKGTRIGESSSPLCGAAIAATHACSSRQLPTDQDYVGGPEGRSTDNRLINRRSCAFNCCPPCATGPPRTDDKPSRKASEKLLTGRSITGARFPRSWPAAIDRARMKDRRLGLAPRAGAASARWVAKGHGENPAAGRDQSRPYRPGLSRRPSQVVKSFGSTHGQVRNYTYLRTLPWPWTGPVEYLISHRLMHRSPGACPSQRLGGPEPGY